MDVFLYPEFSEDSCLMMICDRIRFFGRRSIFTGIYKSQESIILLIKGMGKWCCYAVQ